MYKTIQSTVHVHLKIQFDYLKILDSRVVGIKSVETGICITAFFYPVQLRTAQTLQCRGTLVNFEMTSKDEVVVLTTEEFFVWNILTNRILYLTRLELPLGFTLVRCRDKWFCNVAYTDSYAGKPYSCLAFLPIDGSPPLNDIDLRLNKGQVVSIKKFWLTKNIESIYYTVIEEVNGNFWVIEHNESLIFSMQCMGKTFSWINSANSLQFILHRRETNAIVTWQIEPGKLEETIFNEIYPNSKCLIFSSFKNWYGAYKKITDCQLLSNQFLLITLENETMIIYDLTNSKIHCHLAFCRGMKPIGLAQMGDGCVFLAHVYALPTPAELHSGVVLPETNGIYQWEIYK